MIQDLPEFDPAIAEEFGYAVTNGTTFLGVPLHAHPFFVWAE